jgi:hypothetical protein
MYKLDLSTEFIEKIVILKPNENFPSILNKIRALSENPNAIAIKTGLPIISEYYVNAGRHAILFDTDEDEEMVFLRIIMLRAKLDKILSGKIQATE